MSAALKRIRASCVARAKNRCECGCNRWITAETCHLDHKFGRAREESVESCWALSIECDDERTRNYPSAAIWWARYALHCLKHRYWSHLERALTAVQTQEAKGFA